MPQTLERRRKYIGVILSDKHTQNMDSMVLHIVARNFKIIQDLPLRSRLMLIPRVPDQEKGSTEIDLRSHANQPVLKSRVCIK